MCDSTVMSTVQIAYKGAEQTKQYDGEVRIASDTKRRVSRPKYLKDYVWEPKVLEDDAARSCLGSSLTVLIFQLPWYSIYAEKDKFSYCRISL